MKKSRDRAKLALAKTQEKYDALASQIEQLEAKLQKRYQRRGKLECRVDRLIGHAYPRSEPPDLNARHACLLINPASGDDEDSGDDLGQIMRALASCGIAAEVHLKLSEEYAKRTAREAAARQVPLVIVAGGDDTVEQVAGELVGSMSSLGIVPVGTMNNLARALGIPSKIEDACRLLSSGAVRNIDVGLIRREHGSAEYFLETAGAGLSAIAELGHQKGDGAGSSLPQAVRDFDDEAGELMVELDGGRVLRSASGVVTVANAPRMGAHVTVAPKALLDDGLFDVAIYEKMSRRQVIKYLSRAGTRPRPHPKLSCYQSSRVRITKSLAGAAAGEGRPRSHDLELTIVPRALRVIVGRTPALRS